jgi:enoyl-CoA hydratase/carnithine racemase
MYNHPMNDSGEAGVRFVADGATGRITLDRADQHNALRTVDVAHMHTCLDRAENDPALRVLVLTGTGTKTFCAGASLGEMETGEMTGQLFDELTDRLAHVRLPTVCVLNGSVYGGGATLAMSCDFRIGTPEVRLSVPAARLGVCYPPGGVGRFVRRLGLTNASRILLAAEELGADDLIQIGYLTHCVQRSRLAEEAAAFTDGIASLAPLAVQAMKRVLLGAASASLDLEEADRLVRECSASEDLREGLRAKKEHRAPDFRGR